MSSRSHYDALGLQPSATRDEIREAFERLSSVLDADSLALYALVGAGEQEAEINRVREAHRVLADPAARMRYDEEAGFAPDEIELGDADILSSTPLAVENEPDEPVANERAASVVNKPAASVLNELAAAVVNEPDPQTAETQTAVASGLLLDEPPAANAENLSCDEPPPAPAALEVDENTEFTGELLRALREARSLTPKDVAARTRIGTNYLQAIEDEAFDLLPERVFLRGFLVSFARELKLDAGRVADTYLRRRG